MTPNIPVITISNQLFFEELQRFISQKKDVIIPLKGNSMEPFLFEGEQILLTPYQQQHLSIGLIILAKFNNQIILHRVVKYNREYIWLAGDGNLRQIEKVSRTDVIATAYILYRDQKQIVLTKKRRKYIGYLWFLARPFRIVYAKLNKITRN